jgi:hypothetical protein
MTLHGRRLLHSARERSAGSRLVGRLKNTLKTKNF